MIIFRQQNGFIRDRPVVKKSEVRIWTLSVVFRFLAKIKIFLICSFSFGVKYM